MIAGGITFRNHSIAFRAMMKRIFAGKQEIYFNKKRSTIDY